MIDPNRIHTLKNQVIAANHLQLWEKRLALDVLYKAVSVSTVIMLWSIPEAEYYKSSLAKLVMGSGLTENILWEALPLIEELCHVYPDPQPQAAVAY